MTGERTQPSLWRSAQIRSLFVISFAGLASFSLTLSALPTWASEFHSNSVVGTITGVMLGVTVLTQLGAARMLRQWSARRLLVIGSLLLGAPTPMYLLSTELSVLYGLSAIRGVGFAIVTVVAALAIPRAAPADRQGEAIGIFGLSAAIPMMIGIAGGASLTIDGNFAVVAWLGALPLVALGVARWVDPARPGPAPALARGVIRRLLLPAGLLLAVTTAGGGIVTVLPLRLGDQTAAIALICFGATGMIVRWRIGAVTDRVGHRVALPGLIAAGVIGLVVVAAGLSSSVALLYLGAGLFGIAYGGIQTVTLDLSYRRVPRDAGPTASAVWNAAFDGGTALGSSLLGFTAAGLGGPSWTFVGAAIAVAAVGALALPIATPRRASLPVGKDLA